MGEFGNKKSKETAYNNLVRPILEYAATVWNPYSENEISSIEKAQRTAARWVLNRHRQHRASTPSRTPWNGHLSNNATGKPDWRCFSSSTTPSSPSAPAIRQDQQAADVARGRTTTTAMTPPPAGHTTGRCRSSRELYQTGTVCLRKSWRLTPWTASSPGSTPT